MTRLSDMADPNCEECGGEGHVVYGGGRDPDGEDLPCQKCFPPTNGQFETSWEDLRDDPERDY